MVFGKLFGRGGNEKKPRRQTEDEHFRAWLQSLDPEWYEVLKIVSGSEDVDRVFKSSLQVALSNSDLDEARRLLRLHIMPCLPAHVRDQLKHAGQHQAWANINDLQAAGASFAPDKVPRDALNLGWVETGDDGMVQVRFQGEGHLLTVAPTGAGKGRRFILRNLLKYEGPVV
ncbi:MAG TPA: conjugal transfer protein TraG, partial [Hyphomonas sp.]|nr:conjugal transfer protein TraG [Hyphomonas sp.]